MRWVPFLLLLALGCSHRPEPVKLTSPYDEASIATSSAAPVARVPRRKLTALPLPAPAPAVSQEVHPNWWLLSLSLVTLVMGGLAGYLFGRRKRPAPTAPGH